MLSKQRKFIYNCIKVNKEKTIISKVNKFMTKSGTNIGKIKHVCLLAEASNIKYQYNH